MPARRRLSCPCAGCCQIEPRKLRLVPFGLGIRSPVPLVRNYRTLNKRKEHMKNKTKNSEQPKAAPAYQNRVTLVGYLGRAPEIQEGRAVLSLATKVSWKPKDSDEW